MPLFLDALSNHVPIPSPPQTDERKTAADAAFIKGGLTHKTERKERRHVPLGVVRFVLCLVLIMVVFCLLAIMNVVRERAECRLREKGLWPAAEETNANRAGGIVSVPEKTNGMKCFVKWKPASAELSVPL